MARGKKKGGTLTPEEKLAQALVPDWEQPYKVPGNWCWARIGALSEFERGITFPASAKENELAEDNIPCLRTANVQENLEIDDLIYVNRSFMKGNEAKLVRENDIIMSSANSRELVGKSSFVTHVPFPMTFGGFVLNIRARGISSKYLFYFLRHEFLAGKFMGESTQTTNIANINTTTLGGYELPLPPLAEQQRIVDRIEYLFAKLDEAKEKAQSVLDSFETRKAAILHKAFTGELTAKWRLKHDESMDSWNRMSVDSLCKSLKYGTAKKSQQTGSVVVIRMGNLQNGEIDWSDLAYSDDEEDIRKYQLIPGDVLFNRTNSAALVGKTSIYRGEHPAIYAGYLIKIDYDRSRIVGDYLNYALNTTNAKEYCSAVKTDGVNQSNINAKKIGAYEFFVPTLEEQKEIIRILDNLLAKEQQAKEAAEAVLEKIDLLKKSILARAFRGELGTNDPSEESSVEILKSVLERLDEPKTTVKRTFIPKDLDDRIKTELERKIIKLYVQQDVVSMAIEHLMTVSSKKFDVMEALRNLQQRGVLVKENDIYKLLR